MKVPLLDLRAQYASIKEEIDSAIKKVLDSGIFILGDNVNSFEREFSGYCGAKYGVGVASGTDALELALRALGIGKGDDVITPPFTFIATTEAIVSVGARPVFADIDPTTYNIDPAKIEKILRNDKKKRIKALIPVHLYGQSCDMDEIMNLAKKYRLKVVEDCCQAIGATYKGKKVGTFGDCGCFSFFPSKNLGAYGDGGIVITSNKSVADKIRTLRFHGAKDKYNHVIEGVNSRLDTIQAAILRVKIKHIDKWNDARRRNASLYSSSLMLHEAKNKCIPPREAEGRRHVYNVYALRAEKRDGLRRFLEDKGVTTGMHYPIALHLEEVYRHLGYKKGDFPLAERLAGEVLSLPMYPELKESQIKYVVSQIYNFIK